MCVSSSQDGKLEFDEFKEMMETNSRNKAAAAAATATVAAMALKKGPALKNAALAAASANRRKSSGNPEATKASGSTEVPTTSSTGTAATGNPRYVCSHQKKSFVFPKIICKVCSYHRLFFQHFREKSTVKKTQFWPY